MAIKKEVGFGVNSFNKANVKSQVDSAADLILMLLLSRPGDIPNLPYLGIDIKKYVFDLEGEFSTNELKDMIYNQCNAMYDLVVSEEMNVFSVNLPDGTSALVIYIPIVIDGETVDSAVYAFTKDTGMQLSYKYSLESYLNNTININKA